MWGMKKSPPPSKQPSKRGCECDPKGKPGKPGMPFKFPPKKK